MKVMIRLTGTREDLKRFIRDLKSLNYIIKFNPTFYPNHYSNYGRMYGIAKSISRDIEISIA
jgi:Tfp pilus assembly protein PilO